MLLVENGGWQVCRCDCPVVSLFLPLNDWGWEGKCPRRIHLLQRMIAQSASMDLFLFFPVKLQDYGFPVRCDRAQAGFFPSHTLPLFFPPRNSVRLLFTICVSVLRAGLSVEPRSVVNIPPHWPHGNILRRGIEEGNSLVATMKRKSLFFLLRFFGHTAVDPFKGSFVFSFFERPHLCRFCACSDFFSHSFSVVRTPEIHSAAFPPSCMGRENGRQHRPKKNK
mmetsp:Transcript_13615/g.27038  ORF Transcript_13615/g.27038 Transcript_13615/m.27038 type:complete len:223 (-) Transcript_13615:472-1140(-)